MTARFAYLSTYRQTFSDIMISTQTNLNKKIQKTGQ